MLLILERMWYHVQYSGMWKSSWTDKLLWSEQPMRRGGVWGEGGCVWGEGGTKFYSPFNYVLISGSLRVVDTGMFVNYAVLAKKQQQHSHTSKRLSSSYWRYWLIINPLIEKQLKFSIVFMLRVDSKYLLQTHDILWD